jgi:phage tail sheath protein FI
MATYRTPGVYVEEIPKFPPSVAPVETAIPAFIGYTATAVDKVPGDLVRVPKRITSLVQYEQFFGGPQPETKFKVRVEEITKPAPGKTVGITATAGLAEADRSKHILYYALQMFFANGGGPCWIVSVGAYLGTVGAALVAADIKKALVPLEKVDEPTLVVVPEAQSLGLDDFIALQSDVLAHCGRLQDRFAIIDMHADKVSMSDGSADMAAAVAAFRSKGLTDNLKYGAAYAPNLETVLDLAVDEAQTLVEHVKDGGAATTAKLDSLVAGNNQRYELAKAALRDFPCRLPPSGAVAGVYASVDNSRGVWKAPANVGLSQVVRPAIELSNLDQDLMNIDPTAGKSVNAIRAFAGRGTLIWGARTLAGNDNEWKYVPVRRLFIFVEESVRKATAQFVFEPNDANTWVRVQAMIENFLTIQWRQGALQGIKPEHAFFVAVGLGRTMTPLDILEGRMNVEIGMAAVRPAEFIVLRFSHKMAQS